MRSPPARWNKLPCSDGMASSLAYYPPSGRQARHAHETTQVSFLLSGEMLERHRGSDWTPPGFGIGVKPSGLVHENEWGSSGALIFSVNLDEGLAAEFGATEPGWSASSFDPSVAILVRACLDASTIDLREEAVVDLLAMRAAPATRRLLPPAWLDRARQAIVEEPHAVRIARAAELAGVHRVRFSVLFRQHYGVAPSLYRLRALTARAIRHIADGADAMTDIAHDVGFSDQAHMTRSVRRATGINPNRLRALLS